MKVIKDESQKSNLEKKNISAAEYNAVKPVSLQPEDSAQSVDTSLGAKTGESLFGTKPSKPATLLEQSASQPSPLPQVKSTEVKPDGGSEPLEDTLGPVINSSGCIGTQIPGKRPRPAFGVAAFGGCSKCAQLKRKLNCDIANMKKTMRIERSRYEEEIAKFKINQERLEKTINFTQDVCTRFQGECDELKRKNLKLMVKVNKIKGIIMN